MIFVKSQEKGARVAVKVTEEHLFTITCTNGQGIELTYDEAHQLWVQLNLKFGFL
jgi:hypothetical protein